jgi:hypothetical protein
VSRLDLFLQLDISFSLIPEPALFSLIGFDINLVSPELLFWIVENLTLDGCLVLLRISTKILESDVPIAYEQLHRMKVKEHLDEDYYDMSVEGEYGQLEEPSQGPPQTGEVVPNNAMVIDPEVVPIPEQCDRPG